MNPSETPSSAYWTRHARRYDRVVRVLHPRLPAVIARATGLLAGRAEVLEVAAGTGLFSAALAPRVGRLLATDRDPAMREVLAGRLTRPNVEIRPADALALALPDASVDGVLAANLLHLLPEPARFLAEAHRVLRPGGRLVVPTYVHRETWLARLVSVLLRITGIPVTHRFTGDDVVALVRGAGFTVDVDERCPGPLPMRLVAALR